MNPLEARISHLQTLLQHPTFIWYAYEVMKEMSVFQWYHKRHGWKYAKRQTKLWHYRNYN